MIQRDRAGKVKRYLLLPAERQLFHAQYRTMDVGLYDLAASQLDHCSYVRVHPDELRTDSALDRHESYPEHQGRSGHHLDH